MSAYYIRHEILRHESVRKFSMLSVDVGEKYKIASYGFYADLELKAFVCFSCQQVVKFIDSQDIHQKHRFYTPQCAFLNGRDVSIGHRQWGPDYEYVSLLGVPQFNNPAWFSRPISEEFTKQTLKKYSLQNPDYECRIFQLKYFLGILHLPMFIPNVTNSNQLLNIESFFITMRSEERRLQTFQLRNYPFMFSQDLAVYLAKNGFFFTLLNSAIQCAFCRVIVGNISTGVDINRIHKIMSSKCLFITDDEKAGNLKIVKKIIIPNTTDNVQVQCKICLVHEINIVLNCGHFFCSDCLSKSNIKMCPHCRSGITTQTRIYFN